MVFSAGYYEQKHIYAAWGERMEQFTERGNWDRLLYVHEDIMGNTRYYTKDNGQSFAELEYDVWGAVTSPSKLVNNDNGNFAAAVFTGHPYDTVLDIYFAEARFYDANHRQWMASDPIKSGLNWYEYCYSNPATLFDPNGLQAFSIKYNEQPPGKWDNHPDWDDEMIAKVEANEARVQLEKALKNREKKDAYDRELLRLRAELFEKNQKYEEEWNRARDEVFAQEAAKKAIKEYLEEVENREAREQAYDEWARDKAARDQYWEDARNNSTWQRTIVDDAKDLANWAGGHLQNHTEDTKLYFRKITCEIEKAGIMALLSDPKEQAKFTIFQVNEEIQLIGRILGDYNLTGNASLGVATNMGGVYTHSITANLLMDTKGNILLSYTNAPGVGYGPMPIDPIGLDTFVAVMPGGKITDWLGKADNTGGSITGSKIGVGFDSVDLLSDDGLTKEGSRFVITLKPGGELSAEGHHVKSQTEPILISPTDPINIFELVDEKTGDILLWLN